MTNKQCKFNYDGKIGVDHLTNSEWQTEINKHHTAENDLIRNKTINEGVHASFIEYLINEDVSFSLQIRNDEPRHAPAENMALITARFCYSHRSVDCYVNKGALNYFIETYTSNQTVSQ